MLVRFGFVSRLRWCAGFWIPIASLAGVFGLVPARAYATSVDTVLQRYLTARLGLNLRGTMVVVNAASPYPVPTTRKQIVRTRTGACLTVVTEPAHLRGTVTMDDGIHVHAYEPHHHMVKIQRSQVAATRAFGVSRRARIIRNNYRVDLLGVAPLSGRKCYRLRFVPKHRGSHEIQVWVDRDTGAELGREEKDIRGGTTALTIFTSVEFPRRIARSETTKKFPRSARRVDVSRSPVLTDVRSLTHLAAFPVSVPLSMPSGYVFEDCSLVCINGMRTAVLRYTDGMCVITVCQTPDRAATTARDQAVVRLTQGEAMLETHIPNRQVVVMGHVEPPTLAAVASALSTDRETRFFTLAHRAYNASRPGVRTLLMRGIPAETVVTLLEVKRRTGRTLTGLVQLHQAGWSWRDIARRYGVRESTVIARLSCLR